MREGQAVNCEKCVFFNDCSMQDECVDDCKDFEMTEEAMREEREFYEVEKADAKRKGEWK